MNHPTHTTTDSTDAPHVLDIDDLSAEALSAVVDRAGELKRQLVDGESHRVLPEHTLGMVFGQPSTRTRVSLETGMTQLGGHAIYLGADDMQLGNGEPIADTARALSRYVDAVTARLDDHDDLLALAEHASVPVINALTDEAHPCQTLADLLTVREHHGGFDASVAWVGDGNNVARSFALGAAMVGLDLTVATPEGYGLEEDVLDRADDLGPRPTTTTDPNAAVAGADFVYTDVWVSMSDRADRAEKIAPFESDGFRVTTDLLPEDASFMHCLPAHRGEEVTDAVVESERSVAFDQAENRLHTAKALLVELLDD
jgi:ornithine carbamoyltransferase